MCCIRPKMHICVRTVMWQRMICIVHNHTLTCSDLHLKLQWNLYTQTETVTHSPNYTVNTSDHELFPSHPTPHRRSSHRHRHSHYCTLSSDARRQFTWRDRPFRKESIWGPWTTVLLKWIDRVLKSWNKCNSMELSAFIVSKSAICNSRIQSDAYFDLISVTHIF